MDSEGTLEFPVAIVALFLVFRTVAIALGGIGEIGRRSHIALCSSGHSGASVPTIS